MENIEQMKGPHIEIYNEAKIKEEQSFREPPVNAFNVMDSTTLNLWTSESEDTSLLSSSQDLKCVPKDLDMTEQVLLQKKEASDTSDCQGLSGSIVVSDNVTVDLHNGRSILNSINSDSLPRPDISAPVHKRKRGRPRKLKVEKLGVKKSERMFVRKDNHASEEKVQDSSNKLINCGIEDNILKCALHVLIHDSNGKIVFDSRNFSQVLKVTVADESDQVVFQSLIKSSKKEKETQVTTREGRSHRKKRKPIKIVISSTHSNEKRASLSNVSSNGNVKRKHGRPCKSEILSRSVSALNSNAETLMCNTMEDDIDRMKDEEKSQTIEYDTKNRVEDVDDEIEREEGGDDFVQDQDLKDLLSEAKTSKSKESRSPKVFKDPVSCQICGKIYKTRRCLEKHMTFHKLNATGNPLQCDICQKVYPSWKSYITHRRKHDPTKEQSICDKCGKCFRTKQELVRHSFCHSNVKTFPCHVCGKLFKTKAYVQMHAKIHSEENRKYTCKVCGKNFLRGPDIRKHMRVHTGEKPYVCAQCGRRFSESSHLIRHERLHTGEKPYTCDKCDMRFSLKESLIRHRNDHLPERPFSCSVCGKGFLTKRELQNHWLVHDKPTDPDLMVACKICNKVFSHVLYLRYHMRGHKNPGKYACSMCTMVFKKPSLLRTHVADEHHDQVETDIETLIEEIPVSNEALTLKDLAANKWVNLDFCRCEFCGEVIRDQVELLKHMKSHPEIQLDPGPVDLRTIASHAVTIQEDSSPATSSAVIPITHAQSGYNIIYVEDPVVDYLEESTTKDQEESSVVTIATLLNHPTRLFYD